MEVVIRPIEHGTYTPMTVDAISCTYDMDGFTLMNVVLIAHGLDREYYRQCGRMHEGPKFRVICHGDCYERPQVITVSKTERWDSEPGATTEILTIADCERCESLCMTHFSFILGAFPASAFRHCLESIQSASGLENLERVIVDIDARYYQYALDVHSKVRRGEGSVS
jgi:hypothetical protein